MNEPSYTRRPKLETLLHALIDTSGVMTEIRLHVGDLEPLLEKTVQDIVRDYLKEELVRKAGFSNDAGNHYKAADLGGGMKSLFSKLRENPRYAEMDIEALHDESVTHNMRALLDESLEGLLRQCDVKKIEAETSCDMLAESIMNESRIEQFTDTLMQIVSGDRKRSQNGDIEEKCQAILASVNSDYIRNRIVERAGFDLDPEPMQSDEAHITQRGMDASGMRAALAHTVMERLAQKIGKESVQNAQFDGKAQLEITVNDYQSKADKAVGQLFGRGIAD